MQILKNKKRFISLLVCLSMILGISINITYAEEETPLSTAGMSTEVLALRQENEKHFSVGNGTYQAIAYSHPVHELDSDGNWQDINFSLTLSGTRGNRKYTNESATASFPEQYIANQPILTLGEKDRTIAMSLLTAEKDGTSNRAAITAEVTNPKNSFRTLEEAKNASFASTVLYKDVLPGVDLEYIVDPGTVKENIIVKEKASSYRYTFTLNMTGLYPTLLKDGSILVRDQETDAKKYEIPAPFMYDALGNMSEDVTYTLLGTNDTYTLTVTANADWINAKGRNFPVTIDPTYVETTPFDTDEFDDVGYACMEDTYIDADEPSIAHGFKTMLWVRSNRVTYIRVPTPTLPEDAIINWAELSAYYYYFDYVTGGTVHVSAHRVNGGFWDEDDLTWNGIANLPNRGLSTTTLDSVVTIAGNATINAPKEACFTITGTLRNWINGTSPNYGIGLKYVEDSTNLSVVFRSSESGYTYCPRITYAYFVNGGAYYSALQDIYGFSASDANLIMKLYSKVEEAFPNKSIYEIAWISTRLLGGLNYGNGDKLKDDIEYLLWCEVAGNIDTSEEYFTDTLGFTSTEYTDIVDIIKDQHNTCGSQKGDFAHMQIALAARLAYYLGLDGIVSNLYADDETISYLAGWLGDAVLIESGTTVFRNDDYIADLDAENIYQQILSGKSITLASDHYFGDLSSDNRAQIFLSHISYTTIKTKVYYELIDKALYAEIALAQEQGDIITVQTLLELINNDEYHAEFIETNYPDTHDFLYSIYNERNTIGDY